MSIEKLYNTLVDQNLLSIGFDEFQNKLQDDDYKSKVHGAIVDQDLYSGDFDAFKNQYLTDTPQQEQKEEDTAIERALGKNVVTDFFGDLYRAGEQGLAQGATVDEAFDVYKKGKNISDEELKRYIEVSDALDKTGASDEMRRYEEIKNEAGGGVWGFMKGMVETRGQVIPQVIVSSAAAMGRTFFDSEEAALAAGTGAATAGTAGSFVPIVGTATGAIGGAVAGLTGSMETALTLTELLKEELGDKDFNKENIRTILEDEELFEDIKDRALARGATIGAVEGITVGLSRGVGSKLLAKGASKGKIARQVTGIEMTGGAGGEALGQVAAGQEFDIAEVLMEGVAEAKGVVNVADILAKKEYKINGEKRTRKEVLDKINNTKAESLADIQFEVTGDRNLDNLVKQKQAEAVFETQIDERVDEADRKKLVELEKKRAKAEADKKKTGIFAVPGAKTTLENIENEINSIIDQYANVDRRTSDVRARKKVAGEVRAKVAERDFQANMAFAKKHSELYGLKFTELTQEEVKKRFENTENSDLINSLGGIIGDEIIINKDLAKTRVYGDNVGNHELLHGIIKASKANITQETINDFLNIIGEKNKAKIQERIDKNYTPEYMAENLDEYFTIFSDAIANEEITFNDSVFTKIADAIRRMFASIGLAKVDFESGRGAYNFLKDYNKSIHKGSLSSGVAGATKGDGTSETLKTSKAPETLIKTIKRGGNPRQVATAEDALVPQYQALALEALGYKEVKGDILRENVVSAVNEYYEAIVRNYDPKKGAFSTHVYNNIAPKNDTIFEKAKTLAKRDESISMDAPEAMQIADTAETTDKGPDTRRKKTNILKIGKVEKKADAIKKIVKVKKGDTFKEVSDNNTGKVAEEIFDVPANKITDPKKNLTYAKKIKDGVPEPSEAGNIQSFYGDKQTVEQLVKILPPENVTSSDADINEIGENIDVDREVLGRGLGLTNRMLNYFYNKTNRRSQGLTSQPFIWELKPEFKKPTSEVIDQLQEDLGITPRGELNNYNRNIGQLLKGMAKFQAQQTSLSTAQRILTEQKASKKQIASVTAAQSSKVAFSKSKTEKIVNINVSPNFEGDVKNVNSLLKDFIKKGRYKFDNEANINQFYSDVENILIPSLPENFITKRFIRPSGRVLGTKQAREKVIIVDGKKTTVDDYYKKKMNDMFGPKRGDGYATSEQRIKKGLKPLKYGKPFAGKAQKFKARKYGDVFGNSAKSFDKANKEGKIKEFNEINESMHRQLWQRINESISKNKENARVWGNYFSTVSLITEHPHRLGAEFVGWSPKPKGFDGKLYEWEHAMPASQSYLYLLESILDPNFNFDLSYQLVMDNYKLVALDNYVDKTSIKNAGRTTSMGEGWSMLGGIWLDRYFKGNIDIDARTIVGLDGRTFEDIYSIPRLKTSISKTKKLNKAIKLSRSTQKESKGITVLDFDDTLATTKSLVKYTRPDGTTGTLNAEEYASTYEDLLDQGFTFDFSEFNKVVKGKVAPLFQKALKLQGKFGPENMFVLTARPPAAAKAIFDFLKANGLNIPIKNITGLANSTAEAKALWVADKVGEGFNDFYFADDALQNVQAVKNMLEQFDVKSKVQQAKVKFSKSMNDNFNDILEDVTGIDSKKRFSAIKARKRGESKGKFRFFIPPSHEDFVGLLYNFIGKGKEGNAHRDFFEKALIRPLNRAYRELNAAKQSIANDYKALNKQFPDIKKKLIKKTPDGDFTYQDAVRVYLWDKHGHDISGLSPTDKQNLVDLVTSDSELQTYAETLNIISKQDKYVAPTESWEAGDIRTDLDDATGRIGRKEFFAEFNDNVDVIFSEENLNKIEAAYGADVVSAIKDMLYRIKTGQNRPSGQNALVNKFLNYLNGSVASTMFFNIRSAVLQQMSLVNFINYADNNIIAAAKAFANQKQYWADWTTIFNSDFMKQRRKGIKTDVNGAELAASVKNAKNPIQAAIKKLLELGFLPTQIGDNIAIATGGATFLRNRINTYLKEGMTKKEAEAKAWTDFEILAEATQQSARPDMVSQQQASPLGKVILAFQNVTSQFNRLGKKAFLDIKNRRITPGNSTQLQSDMSNLSRIAYYLAIQNLVFYSLQSALFMAMFDDDEEDERWLKKKERMVNGSIDSVLRGTGVWGAVVATLKNMAIKWHEQRDKGYNADESAVLMEMLNVSPPLGIKARKLVNAEKTLNYNKKTIDEMETFDIDNPMWSAVTSYTEATTNIPLNRLYNKTMNVRESLNNQHSAFERTLLFGGWSKWNLGIEDVKKEKKKQKFSIKKKSKGRGTLKVY